ncbi:hypothetical protein K402DRAFT_170290 [Aulographum hederae CBS 113979]|uniref:Uncharacterized protein n=1 Tax=Aulographum hederae CBS 113979 TaxID=1176131 RepID=A0A6G1HDC1_9PEZI|nr:hypothetical protein K402DRAFT_170290 [Aulographum hederae CBS 113979]
MAPNTNSKTAVKAQKPTFKVTTPYGSPIWPEISSAKQDVILDLLCSLLAPIGHHRNTHITPSKGRRSEKRKRSKSTSSDAVAPAAPPPPEIQQHVLVGINSVTRHLEVLANLSKPEKLQHGSEMTTKETRDAENKNDSPSEADPKASPLPSPPQHVAAIFLPKYRNDMIYAHLPLLLRTASFAHPDSPITRLVPLSPKAEQRLAAELGIPRVGVIGILSEAAGAILLLEYVLEHVEEVQVPWLDEAVAGRFLGLKMEVT